MCDVSESIGVGSVVFGGVVGPDHSFMPIMSLMLSLTDSNISPRIP